MHPYEGPGTGTISIYATGINFNPKIGLKHRAINLKITARVHSGLATTYLPR